MSLISLGKYVLLPLVRDWISGQDVGRIQLSNAYFRGLLKDYPELLYPIARDFTNGTLFPFSMRFLCWMKMGDDICSIVQRIVLSNRTLVGRSTSDQPEFLKFIGTNIRHILVGQVNKDLVEECRSIISLCSSLTSIDLEHCGCAKVLVDAVSSTKLTTLRISGHENLARLNLERFKQLKDLSLVNGCDATFDWTAVRGLTSLNLLGGEFSMHAVASCLHRSKLTTFRGVLDTWHINVMVSDFKHILTDLEIESSPASASGIASIVQNCWNLSRLAVRRCEKFDDCIIDAIAQYRRGLKLLDVRDNKKGMSNRAFRNLLTACTHLEVLRLGFQDDLSDDPFLLLADLAGLREFSTERGVPTKTVRLVMERCPLLTSLCLGNNCADLTSALWGFGDQLVTLTCCFRTPSVWVLACRNVTDLTLQQLSSYDSKHGVLGTIKHCNALKRLVLEGVAITDPIVDVILSQHWLHLRVLHILQKDGSDVVVCPNQASLKRLLAGLPYLRDLRLPLSVYSQINKSEIFRIDNVQV